MRGSSFLRDSRFIAIFLQAAVVLLVLVVLWQLFENADINLGKIGVKTGFSFLWDTAPFNLGFTPFWDYQIGTSKYWEVFVIGIQNTLLVSVLTIISSTLLGFLVGVARLSHNWLAARLASAYIETFRNIPLLLQLMFWNFAVFLPILPQVRSSFAFADAFFLNKAGLYFPDILLTDIPAGTALITLIFALSLLLWGVRKKILKYQERTGVYPRKWAGCLYAAVIMTAITAYYALGTPLAIEYPQAGRFDFTGGLHIPLPLFSLWVSLTAYTSAFIAENVRSGIISVDKGQLEAAYALGLPRRLVLRKIIIPQAMRTIIPPTINQYLNATKNSSLAIAVAYEDITNVWSGIALNQTGQAIIIIGMTILVYEVLSLITSGMANYYNRHVQLVER